MPGRRSRSDVQIFSTSFLDLLFCGLAAVVLLWVLLEPAETKEPKQRFSSMMVRQQGYFHLATITLRDESGNEVVSLDRLWQNKGDRNNNRGTGKTSKNGRNKFFYSPRGSNNFPQYTKEIVRAFVDNIQDRYIDQDDVPQLLFELTDVDDDGFAGGATVVCNSDCRQGEIILTFRKCGAADHQIELLNLNESSEKTDRLLFDNKGHSSNQSILSRRTEKFELLDITLSFGRGRIKSTLNTRL